jgi:hypothetical protein
MRLPAPGRSGSAWPGRAPRPRSRPTWPGRGSPPAPQRPLLLALPPLVRRASPSPAPALGLAPPTHSPVSPSPAPVWVWLPRPVPLSARLRLLSGSGSPRLILLRPFRPFRPFRPCGPAGVAAGNDMGARSAVAGTTADRAPMSLGRVGAGARRPRAVPLPSLASLAPPARALIPACPSVSALLSVCVFAPAPLCSLGSTAPSVSTGRPGGCWERHGCTVCCCWDDSRPCIHVVGAGLGRAVCQRVVTGFRYGTAVQV